MSVAATLTRLGGCASAAELLAQHSRREVRRAWRAGEIDRPERGRFVLATVAEHRRLAHARSAVQSHLSAALGHGWKVKTSPDVAHVTVPRKRRVRAKHRKGLALHWADLSAADVENDCTTPLRTVLDCARTLPFDEALAVADSALRSRKVSATALRAAATNARGTASARIRRVAAHADARAANPLESVLRALAIEEGFTFTPQFQIADPGLFAVVDLGDARLRLVLEAEGFETHGTREGLRRDCRRHTEFAVFGWDSMRYSYEDVMFGQDWVRWTLRTWLAHREGRPVSAPPARWPHAA